MRAPPLLPAPPADPTLLRRTFEAPPFFSFHHANAYEAGGKLVIDTVGGAGGARSDVCR
jgi:carotenoid cleavage dioxygenase-like enzyme